MNKEESTKNEYRKNTPKSDAYYDNYLELLNDKINEEDIKNIGIFAPYGGGKSSLIKNYLDKYNPKRENVLNISLASFNDMKKDNPTKTNFIDTSSNLNNNDDTTNNNDSNGNPEGYIQDIESYLERGILEQIIFSDNAKMFSRIDRINHNRIRNIILDVLAITILMISLFIIISECFFPTNKIYSLINELFIIKYVFISSLVLGLLTFVYLLVKVLFYAGRVKISFRNIETEIEKNCNGSILNVFIDEIIYYFATAKTKLVIIEDLDRFKSVNVFSKLREINYIINNSKQVAQKVTFLYAIRDDMFKTSTDKAKFFDFTLPYIPFYSIVTARDYISKSVKELGDKYKLEKEYINDISHYIPEMRILNNIINDYNIYLKMLSNGTNIKVSNEYVFSILTYKNIMPSDYSEFLNKQGVLYDLITKMQECKNDIKTSLIAENASLNNQKEKILENTIINKRQLKYMIIGIITKHGSNNSFNYLDLTNNSEITGSELGYYINILQRIYALDRKQVEQHLGMSIHDYFDYLNKKESGEIDRIEKDIQVNKFIIDKINKNAISVAELADQYERVNGSNNIKIVLNKLDKPENEKDEVFRFFYYCIKNRYIDERSINYLIYHNDVIITNTDREVEYKITYENGINYDQRVDNPLLVIKDISTSALYNRSFLINDIVKTLLDYDGNDNDIIDKKKKFLNHLSSDEKDVNDFLIQFINSKAEIDDEVFKTLLSNTHFCEKVLFSPTIFEEIKRQYIVRLVELIFLNDGLEIFEKQTAKIMIKEYIEIDPTPFDTFVLNKSNIRAFLAFLEKYNIQLENINSEMLSNKEYLKVIINNNNYRINHNNITFILETMYEVQEETINTKLISCIKNTGNEKLIERMNSFKEMFLNIIIDLPNNYSDDNSIIEEILEDENISIDIKKKLINKVITLININSKIDGSLISDLVNKKIVIGSWNNYSLLNNDPHEKTIFIDNNINKLSSIKLKDINIEKEVVNLDISQENLRKLCKAFANKLILSDCKKTENLVVLIQEGIVEANLGSFIVAYNAPIVVELYNKNEELINSINEIGFDKKVLIDLMNNYPTSKLVLEYIKTYQKNILNEKMVNETKKVLIDNDAIQLDKDFLVELFDCANHDESAILLEKYISFIKNLDILKEVLEKIFNQENESKNNDYVTFKKIGNATSIAEELNEKSLFKIEIKIKIIKIKIND